MPNNPRAVDNLIPAKKGEVRNPMGKPKGTIHLSTMIQNMLNEPMDPDDIDPKQQGKTKMQVIIATATIKAKEGDNKWADWLAKYGYGQKFELEHSGEIGTGVQDPALALEFSEFLKTKTKS